VAPKPERARLVFAFGMVLAMAVTILAILTWTRPRFGCTDPADRTDHQPQHLISY